MKYFFILTRDIRWFSAKRIPNTTSLTFPAYLVNRHKVNGNHFMSWKSPKPSLNKPDDGLRDKLSCGCSEGQTPDSGQEVGGVRIHAMRQRGHQSLGTAQHFAEVIVPPLLKYPASLSIT